MIYLDYNATTPPDPRVIDAMEPYLRRFFGNAASPHVFGATAREAVDEAREQVAALVGARPHEIVFTSGATESDNLAVLGALGEERHGHVVTTAVEHPAVLDPVEALRRRGCAVTVLQPDATGRVDPEAVADALRHDTVLVSIMGANNEIGTLAPTAEIGHLCHAAGVLFHCDAAQLVGKLPVDVDDLGVDLLSMSAHKLHGPKGIGALFVRRGTPISPIVHGGGGQERGLRSGTLNVPAIVGFGTAAAIARHEMAADIERCERLRLLLLDRLGRAFPDFQVNGHPTERLPGTVNVRLPGIDADSLQLATPEVAVSSGSACTSATPEPSHVLRAIGLSWGAAQECVRLSFGRFTTEAEIEDAVDLLAAGAARLAGDAPPLVEVAR